MWLCRTPTSLPLGPKESRLTLGIFKNGNKPHSAKKNMNGTQNTTLAFANNWDLASTWTGGVAVNTGDSVYKDGDLYTAKQDLTATENTSSPAEYHILGPRAMDFRTILFPWRIMPRLLYFSRIGSQQGNGPHASEQGEDWIASRTYDYGQIVHYQGNYYRCLANSFNNKVSATSAGNTEDIIITPGDALIPSNNALFSTLWSIMTSGGKLRNR